MNVLNCSLRFRPVRIGWCLHQNDWTAFQESLKLNFILAGGQFNPLIPIEDENYARALIRAFRVDLLLSVTEEAEIQAFIDKFPYLSTLTSRAFWESFQGGKIPRFVDISHTIKKQFGQAHKNSPDYQLLCYDWLPDDPLAHVLLATFGTLPQPSPKEIDYVQLLGKGVSVQSKTLTLKDPFPVPSRDPFTLVPSNLCRLGVEQHYLYRDRWRHAGLYVGCADNFQDVVNFWNLKATNTFIAFYDPSHAERLSERKQDLLTFFLPLSNGATFNTPPLALWCQTLDILDKSEKWGMPTNLCKLTAISWNGSNIDVPYMYFSEHQIIGIQSTSFSGRPTISIQRPSHPFDDEIALQSQQMVIAIQPQSLNLIDHTTTFQLPFIPELNPYYDRACHFGTGLACTRVEPDGIGFIQQIYHHYLSIQPVKVTEIISKLFSLYGIEANLSDAGLTTQRLIHQMGSLQDCRLFKIKGVRELIKKFGPTKEFAWGDAAALIRDKDETTKKCSFDHYSHVYINGKNLDANGVIEALLGKRVFSAGLKLTCPNCLFKFWTPIDRLSSNQICEYCQHEFNILPYLNSTGGRWHFRPSGLFAQGDDPEQGGDQKGAIPVVVSLQQMELALDWGKVLYTTSLNFQMKGSTHFACESDFVIVLPKPNLENKIEVVIAECKSRGGTISHEDVTKLGMLADILPEDQFCVYIVFSKFTKFSPEELDMIATLNVRRTRTIVFTAEDLEALRPYETLQGTYKQPLRAGKLQEMAEITRMFILSKPAAGYPVSNDRHIFSKN